MSDITINHLREHLLATLQDLRSRHNPMDPSRARVIADVASVMLETAKVEVDYARVTQQHTSTFIQANATTTATGTLEHTSATTIVHRLRG